MMGDLLKEDAISQAEDAAARNAGTATGVADAANDTAAAENIEGTLVGTPAWEPQKGLGERDQQGPC